MKYFGEKSLSSVLSVLFKIAWWVIMVGAVIGGILGFMFILSTAFVDPATMGADIQGEDWEKFKQVPTAMKMLFLAYLGVLAVLLLKIIRKSQELFTNFRNEIVFDQTNVNTTANIGKLMVWYAILTVDLGTLFVSLLLLMLCELFKSGASLQEEHDLTV